MSERKKLARALSIAELERINHVTANNARNIAHEMAKFAILATDAQASQRRSERRCPACEYLGRYRLAGQAFTQWRCQLCAQDQPAHPNTAVPRLCLGCAATYSLCVSCGGDIESEHRGRRTGRRARDITAAIAERGAK